jgi:hypothetical protein
VSAQSEHAVKTLAKNHTRTSSTPRRFSLRAIKKGVGGTKGFMQRRSFLWALLNMNAIFEFGAMGLTIVISPQLIESFGCSALDVSILMASTTVVQGVAGVFWGRVAEHFGKHLVILGLNGVACATLNALAAMAINWETFLALLVVRAFFFGSMFTCIGRCSRASPPIRPFCYLFAFPRRELGVVIYFSK